MPRNYRSLKALKIRPDWNKYTLYALSRLQRLRHDSLTFFQQKWRAKSALRAYHGPHVREGYWEKLFSRRLHGVVPMDYKYLARNDGSELASGRGAGAVTEQDGVISVQNGQSGLNMRHKTPYMGMAFFPLERRLDTAIWRALFASSVAQARQMVVHGSVKVNGKKMRHAGYLLNPGDMFQIDPDKVMYSTGEQKKKKDQSISRVLFREQPLSTSSQSTQTSGEQRLSERDTRKTEKETGASATAASGAADPAAAVDAVAKARKELKKVRDLANDLLSSGKQKLSGNRLQELRRFHRTLRSTMSKLGHKTDEQVSMDVAAFQKAFEDIVESVPDAALPTDQAQKRRKAAEEDKMEADSARDNAELLAAALEKARENPVDSTKPYATPWRPRPFMSTFAFIPRYLEVNQMVCSAVYLRHPVARPGLAEVPTPFDPDTQQLGFNWYLRRS